ncbi:MAG: hypothetical protein ACK54K_12630 [Gemmatimonadaceae bacterium]
MSTAHVMNAVTRAAPRPAPKAAPAARRETVDTDAESIRDKDRKPDASRPEFAALLALLAAMGQQVRTDLVQQLPEEAASLVDRLLQDAAPMTGAATPSADGTNAQSALTASAQPVDGASPDHVDGPTDDRPAGDVVDLLAYARARETSTERTPAQAAVAPAAPHDDRAALQALAHIASQRGASIEQLLAIGDARGAEVRAALDAILAQAGSPAGARLAARQLERNTTPLALATAETRSGDVTTPVRDLDAVAPELRGKVARVIDRMKREYGHDVTLVETVRSQERQDWLYEQGRSRRGPVVTWTRDSAHTRGEAVDVLIDGSWDNAQGFARLQRIAREEGLRTLGLKDPGHLELAGHGAPVDPAAAATLKVDRQIPRPEPTASAAGMAQVASVAGVAGVARVAEPSGAARIATQGGTATANGLAAYTAPQQATRLANDTGNGNGEAFGRGDRDARGTSLQGGRQRGHDQHDTTAPAFGALTGTAGVTTTSPERVATASAPAGSVQAERVADIQQMRADAPAGPLSRMTLNVDNANGTQETITVDVRGNTVTTQITTAAAPAERIRMRSADLQDALGRHGLESERLRVGASKPQDTVEIGRVAAGEREALKIGGAPPSGTQDGAAGNSQRERAPAREWQQDESRREQAARARAERQQQQQQDRNERQEHQRRVTSTFGVE